MIIAYVGITYGVHAFLSKQKQFVAFLDSLATFEEHEKPLFIEETNKTYNFFSKIFMTYVLTAAFLSYGACKNYDLHACEKKNLEYGRDEVCGMLVPVWLPFEFNYTPIKQIVLLIQFVSATTAVGTGCTINFVSFLCMQYLRERIRHLRFNYQKVFADPKRQRIRLFRCIRHHNKLIK